MNKLITLSLLLGSFAVHAQNVPSPLKHSLDPACEVQVSAAVILSATRRFGPRYQILTSGYKYDVTAILESFPTIKNGKAVITLKRRTTGVKSEIYYLTTAQSVGLGANGQPIHRCQVTVTPASLATYEAAGGE